MTIPFSTDGPPKLTTTHPLHPSRDVHSMARWTQGSSGGRGKGLAPSMGDGAQHQTYRRSHGPEPSTGTGDAKSPASKAEPITGATSTAHPPAPDQYDPRDTTQPVDTEPTRHTSSRKGSDADPEAPSEVVTRNRHGERSSEESFMADAADARRARLAYKSLHPDQSLDSRRRGGDHGPTASAAERIRSVLSPGPNTARNFNAVEGGVTKSVRSTTGAAASRGAERNAKRLRDAQRDRSGNAR